MEPKRLTGEIFAALLAKYPTFQLRIGSWCSVERCGGCAMTLAYHDANPTVPLKTLNPDDVEFWATTVYGIPYVDAFIAAFDDFEVDGTVATQDGVACLEAAYAAGRLVRPEVEGADHV